jgi:hypothetical protein
VIHDATGNGAVRFTFAEGCVEGPHNAINVNWFDAVNSAILDWEGTQSDDGES